MRKKTKDIYAESLLQLIEKSSYDVVTISEICDNTPLTRRTFYNNFKSKDEVVVYICDNLMHEYIIRIHKEKAYTLAEISTTFCKFVALKKDIFMTLINNNIYHIFGNTAIRNFSYIISLVPNNVLEEANETHRNYSFLFHTAGVLKITEQWLISGMKESAEELSSIYMSIIRDVRNL